MASQGKPRGVYVVTDADLEGAVGGTFIVQPGPAIAAAGFAAATRGAVGGKAQPVYVVDATEAARRGLMGGKPIPIVDVTSTTRAVSGTHNALPVYMVSGSEYIGDGGVTPVPPTPPVVAAELIETFFGDTTIAVQGNQEKSVDEYWGGFIV